MRSKTILIFLTVMLALSSCATSRYISGDEFTHVEDAVLIKPIANISYHHRDNLIALDQELSAQCTALLTDALLQSELPVSDIIDINDEPHSIRYIEEINDLKYIAPTKKDVVPVSPELDRLLEEKGCRYGIVLLANGFDRDVKNYRKAATKSIILGVITTIATLGTVTLYTVPERYELNTCIAIYDSQTDRMIYFDRLVREASPTLPAHVQRQVAKLVKRYLTAS